MGLSEVCEMTGKSKNYMKEYLRRGQFPQPVKELACGPLGFGGKFKHGWTRPGFAAEGRKTRENKKCPPPVFRQRASLMTAAPLLYRTRC